MTQELRARARHVVRTDVMVTGVGGRLLGETTLDASWDGLLVKACDMPRVGERVHVILRVPRSRFWIRAGGRVTRVVAGQRAGDEGPAFALSLDHMHGMDRLVLANTIARAPTRDATRGPGRDYARMIARIHASA